MQCRKDFMDLTTIERDRLADALNAVYASGLITQLANLHNDSWDHIHFEPQFLPWHRYFIRRIEKELQKIDPRVTMPYWDWTRPDSRDLDAGIWKSFFGGRDNTGGRFDHWSLTRAGSAVGGLPGIGLVATSLDAGNYTAFRGVESSEIHVGAHRWVGGDMFSGHSPRDPLFYLHHCNIDRIWAIWQLNNPAAAQYDTSPIASDSNSPGAPDTLDEAMVGGATVASMLDHRAVGPSYHEDIRLAAERPGTIAGDEIVVSLVTSTVQFNDVPEGDETRRPATFLVEGCGALSFTVSAGPTGPFELHDGDFVSFPQTDLDADQVRIWVRYRGTNDGDIANGLMTVEVTDPDGAEVATFIDIVLLANTVKRKTAAVTLVLDESGSMLYDAGNGRKRIEVLQRAARTFVDNLYDDNALAIVSFDDDATIVEQLAVAGGLTSSVRNDARQAIQNHGPPDDKPHTSIGAGLEKANEVWSTSPIADDFDVKATVVFTDGVQDREPWISDVSAAVPDRIYAVGVANAANVANDVLQQLAASTGGVMLVTGAVEQDDEFLLEKFFIQILAGVVNHQMVVDPPGTLRWGEIESVPFKVTRADIGFDAVILTAFPQAVVAALQAPDGTVIPAAALPAGSLRVGATSLGFRVDLPVVVGHADHWAGEWNVLMTLRPKFASTATFAAAANVPPTTAMLPHHTLVHARSNLFLRAAVEQHGLEPGSTMTITARIDEYGWPIESGPTVRALVRRPDRSSVVVAMEEIETGRWQGDMVGDIAGPYLLRVLADGTTTAGEPFTREQLLTAVVGRPTTPPPGGGSRDVEDGVRSALCTLLECLRNATSPELRRRLEATGFSLDDLTKCLCGAERSASVERWLPDLRRLLSELLAE